MNPLVLMSIAHALKGSWDEQVNPPVKVAREGDLWRIVDGRHRVVGSLIAGRERAWCVEDVGKEAEEDGGSSEGEGHQP